MYLVLIVILRSGSNTCFIAQCLIIFTFSDVSVFHHNSPIRDILQVRSKVSLAITCNSPILSLMLCEGDIPPSSYKLLEGVDVKIMGYLISISETFTDVKGRGCIVGVWPVILFHYCFSKTCALSEGTIWIAFQYHHCIMSKDELVVILIPLLLRVDTELMEALNSLFSSCSCEVMVFGEWELGWSHCFLDDTSSEFIKDVEACLIKDCLGVGLCNGESGILKPCRLILRLGRGMGVVLIGLLIVAVENDFRKRLVNGKEGGIASKRVSGILAQAWSAQDRASLTGLSVEDCWDGVSWTLLKEDAPAFFSNVHIEDRLLSGALRPDDDIVAVLVEKLSPKESQSLSPRIKGLAFSLSKRSELKITLFTSNLSLFLFFQFDLLSNGHEP
ncbi:hypothetical protein EV421DRAFT_1744155 [Armillaria borealis]|uniref:Uncharacterized protein n=1 Tax=Armillaria borealis TaxID=47425 RepID=A0AA39ME14_9AGAR|nr:hypothetical protein EV421DRAFT_1744155 [Armillaria borealis]